MNDKLTSKVINRLTLYHCILADYEENSCEYISSVKIANLLKLDNSQVRKDIKLLNNTGKCNVGYDVKALKKSIEKALGFEDVKDVFIIGAGNLGAAIAKYDRFQSYGLNVIALFDTDENKIGTAINNKKIYDIKDLPELSKKMNVDVAILTVPRRSAQKAADYLIKGNIKYIWNFTHYILDLPDTIKVWNENLIGNFLQFTLDKNKDKND